MGKIIKNTALISILTLLSRFLGVVRDALIAMYFGTSAISDTFFVAFRPFDLVRKLFSEGILSISFIPVFTAVIKKDGKAHAASMVLSLLCFFSLVGVLAMVVGVFFSPFIVKLIAPGFHADPAKLQLTAVLFKIMIPYFLMICLVAVSTGVLNTFENFGIPALSPVIFNLSIISATIILTSLFEVPVWGLAVGVVLGGVVQLGLQIPFMIKHGMLNLSFFRFFHPATGRVIKIMIPCMIGAASYQINILIASLFASALDDGSVSFLYYADRLVQFPLALFAVSVATVFLPELSKKAQHGQMEDVGARFSIAARMVFFITIPAMAGLMALNQEIVLFLFGRGQFDTISVLKTSNVLFVLVTGLWAFTGTRLFVTLYYAVSNIKIPFYCGLISIGANCILSFIYLSDKGLEGLVLSVSISSMIGFILLFLNIPKSVLIDKKQILYSACRSLFLSVIMFFLVKKAGLYLCKTGQGTLALGAGLLSLVVIGIAVYIGLNILLKTSEFKLFQKGILDKWQ